MLSIRQISYQEKYKHCLRNVKGLKDITELFVQLKKINCRISDIVTTAGLKVSKPFVKPAAGFLT